MRSVRPRVRESRGCAVLAVLASDQKGALGASLLAPKAPRPSSSRKFSASCPRPPGGPASKRLIRRATSGKPHDPCLFRRGLPNQTTARGKAPRTHEDPSRRGRLAQPEAANGPWKKQFFLRLFCSPPDTRRPDQNFIIGFAINRSTLSWCPSWFQRSGCAMFTLVRG